MTPGAGGKKATDRYGAPAGALWTRKRERCFFPLGIRACPSPRLVSLEKSDTKTLYSLFFLVIYLEERGATVRQRCGAGFPSGFVL